MSDDVATFNRKTEAMFGLVERQVEEIGRRFAVKMAWRLISTTPGPNLQYPSDTAYIATGRLRAAWHVSAAPLGNVSRWDDGPYTEHGVETLAKIEGELRGRFLLTDFYLVNDVAYGHLVHEGKGRHTMARRWVQNAADDAEAIAIEARMEVMGR